MEPNVYKKNPDYGATENGDIYSRKSGIWRKLKPQTDTDGYQQVRLFGAGTNRLTFVHRIIADVFMVKPQDCTEINHIDGNKRNNSVSNLEWCTRRRNMLHAHDAGLINTRTPILVTNMSTGERFVCEGQHEAARRLGINQGNINHALKRDNGTCCGYSFQYIDKEGSYE